MDVYCPNTESSGKLCLHKRTYQSLGRGDYQCSQCGSVCQLLNVSFQDQTNSFFKSFGHRVYILFKEGLRDLLKGSPESIQDIIGDVYIPGAYCLNREKCESLDGYVTTPRSIYGCGKCGGWFFVYKVQVPLMLQEHIKTTKTDKTRFFAKKSWTCYPTNNCSIIFHFNQPNIERKNCVWTTKYKRLLGTRIVRHVEMKSVFTFQPIKHLDSTTIKMPRFEYSFYGQKTDKYDVLAVTVHNALQ